MLGNDMPRDGYYPPSTVRLLGDRIDELQRQLAKEERLSHLQAQALAEIKATIDGDSDQPIADIIYGCISEIANMKKGQNDA